MQESFQVVALSGTQFTLLLGASDEELQAYGARRMTVDQAPGYPCRVSLSDASVGETVLLLSFTHHDVASPYRASGPIFVREQALAAEPGRNEIPEMLRRRPRLSVRAYDSAGWLVAADIVAGEELDLAIPARFADERASYLHVHNARTGCYLASVVRAAVSISPV
jgi:hypothetical protein